MKKIFVFVIGFLIATNLLAQVKISGSVKDVKGRAVPGVSITLKDTYDGATTDSSGRFTFKTAEKGEHVLLFTSIGFKEIEQKINISTEPAELTIVMKEKLDELKAVMVTAGTFEASDKKRAATVLSTLDVLTTGGANADISAAVRTLPGAQQVGEQEGLFVRGGTGAETKQFIDGTMVNNPFYSSVPDIAQRGRFSPSLFKGTVFSTGGYSALYGQALSSALILESIDMPEKSEANVGISGLFLSAGIQKVSKDKKTSGGINYGYTNLAAYFKLIKQKPDYFKIPEFHGADANFRFKTKNGGIVKYYTTWGISKLGLRRPDIDSVDLKNAFGLENINWYNNLSWKESLRNGWKMSLGMSYSTNLDKINNQVQDQQNQPKTYPGQVWENKNFDINSRQDLSQVRAVFEKRLRGISSIRFGSEYMYAYNRSTYKTLKGYANDHYNAAFAESDIYLTNALAAKIGGRVEYSSIIDKANVAPRLSLAYKTGKDAQVSLAYGLFYQKPENTQLFQTTDLGYTKAAHYIANYQKTNKFYTFRVEAFYKEYSDLIKTTPAINNNGEGYAKGIEVFWRDKKTIKNLDYWVSYSYLDTKRDHLNYPQLLEPNFAAKNTVSLVTKRWFTKLSTGVNFTYSYATGRPYYNFKYNSSTNKYSIADRGTTKDFHNLGFSANYVKQVKNSFAVLVASVTNVLGANPVYGYNYSSNGLRKEAIGNPATRFYFIGLFVSWGVDRTQDAINGNL